MYRSYDPERDAEAPSHVEWEKRVIDHVQVKGIRQGKNVEEWTFKMQGKVGEEDENMSEKEVGGSPSDMDL